MKRQNIYRDYWDNLFWGSANMRGKAKRIFRRLAKRRMRREENQDTQRMKEGGT